MSKTAHILIILTLSFVSACAGKELADKDELYTGKEFTHAFQNPKDTNLPNVLLIGDSISIGYTVDVRKQLKGKADVFRIPTNGRNAAYGVQNIDRWIGKKKWDVIHFNWGLWDLCYRNPQSKTPGHQDKKTGKITATPEEYAKSLKAIVAQLKKTNAKLIWCTTTPVPENEAGRIVGDAIIYNQVAEKIMRKNHIVINDLFTHAQKKLPNISKKKGDVHFSKEGYAYLAKKVAAEITKQLPAKQLP
jgi:hypothetical protein